MTENIRSSHRMAVTTKFQKSLKKSRKHIFSKVVHVFRLWLSSHLYRCFELAICTVVLIFLTLPLHLFLFATKFVLGKKVFIKQEITGVEGLSTSVNYFNTSWYPVSCLALFYHVISGKLTIVGIGITKDQEVYKSPEKGYLHTSKPGIFSLWQVRKNSKTGHEGSLETEWEYFFTRNAKTDLLLILRALPTYLYSQTLSSTAKFINLFGIELINIKMKRAVRLITSHARVKTSATPVFFTNPDCLNKTFTDKDYRSILKKVDLVFPDGIGLTIACKILQTPLQENINGTDMLPFLCEAASRKKLSLFLLGAEPGVAQKTAQKLHTNFNVSIAGTHHGYFNHELESKPVIETINASGADIVLVAFGTPLQEKWIWANRDFLQTGVVMGVGGLFDFYSGNTKRAPRWLRELGLEWVYRILQEPQRMWKRYLIGNPLFLLRVLMWKSKRTKTNEVQS